MVKQRKTDNKEYIISKCVELIRSFNAVTHSIDTHVGDQLGDVSKPDAPSENVFIQQVVYGWYKERDALQVFISNFYADNAASVLRIDSIMYTVFAYLAIYRLDELGFPRFKEFTNTQEPTKMYNFVMYLFSRDNLMSCLRADWMKVRDLDYVEDELIAGIERFIPDATRFCDELQLKAVGMAAAQAAKEEMKKSGMAGVGKVEKAGLTVPVSPRMNKPRPPKLPEPERIPTQFIAPSVPEYLEFTNLELIAKQRGEERDAQREKTMAKYPEKYQFKFQELKAGRDMEEVRREVEEARTKDIDFNASFVHEPPDFSKIPAKVRLNASAIYREDALFRKQQAKDAKLLKQYEEELRDQTEFLIWQKDMKGKDKANQLELIAQRKEAILQSHINTHEAIMKQKDDNRNAADMLRQEADDIKIQKELEMERAILRNQVLVQAVTEVREIAPKVAVEKVLEARAEKGKVLREELDAARRAKEKQDQIEEEIRADKIRQLRAENEVLRKHVNVFDPTEIKGAGFLDEMSYLEMKIRLANEKERAEREEADRRQRIFVEKEKRAKDLEERSKALMKVRQTKSETSKTYRQKRIEAEIRENELIEKARQEAAIVLEAELREKREEKSREAAALRAEEERVRRQQLYLGAAAGLVEETREAELLKAKERIISVTQQSAKEEAQLLEHTLEQAKANRFANAKREKVAHEKLLLEKERLALEEKKRAVQRLREEVLARRSMALIGREQHEKTKVATIVHNPYAHTISTESVENARLKASRNSTATMRR